MSESSSRPSMQYSLLERALQENKALREKIAAQEANRSVVIIRGLSVFYVNDNQQCCSVEELFTCSNQESNQYVQTSLKQNQIRHSQAQQVTALLPGLTSPGDANHGDYSSLTLFISADRDNSRLTSTIDKIH